MLGRLAQANVLNVVPNEGNRDTRVSSIDVETSEAVEQPELRGKLRIGYGSDARGVGCSADADDGGCSGRVR